MLVVDSELEEVVLLLKVRVKESVIASESVVVKELVMSIDFESVTE